LVLKMQKIGLGVLHFYLISLFIFYYYIEKYFCEEDGRSR